MSLPIELCCECGCATGRAGIHDDSLYTEDYVGPYCEECFDEATSASEKG